MYVEQIKIGLLYFSLKKFGLVRKYVEFDIGL